ncbi:MAG TPA: hypothetical protein PK812_01305 [Beijerinckiaceae bacterium]|nr:hypothetical protein [Beijerinckiaceae bacterium]
MFRPRRRSLTREIIALALSSVVFIAAVAAARLQGAHPGARAGFSGVLCLSDDTNPEVPGKSPAMHQHCVLCAFAASDCGGERPPETKRFATRAAPDPSSEAAVVVFEVQLFDARGPPALI